DAGEWAHDSARSTLRARRGWVAGSLSGRGAVARQGRADGVREARLRRRVAHADRALVVGCAGGVGALHDDARVGRPAGSADVAHRTGGAHRGVRARAAELVGRHARALLVAARSAVVSGGARGGYVRITEAAAVLERLARVAGRIAVAALHL